MPLWMLLGMPEACGLLCIGCILTGQRPSSAAFPGLALIASLVYCAYVKRDDLFE